MAPKNKRTKEEPAARAVWASREYGMDKKEELQSSLQWLRCPRCGGKTRIQVRPHTVLEDFPLFCPKCRYACVIHFKDGRTVDIKMPDA